MDNITQKENKSKEIVRLHNNFIQAIFSLSTDAKKLLLLVWLHANPEKSNIVEIYQKDIQEKIGIDIAHLNPKHREEIIEELMQKIITIRDVNNKNNFIKFSLLGDTKYKNGVLKTNLSLYLLPYIKEAQEKLFTRFNILSIKPLRSSYAIRTYLFCKQFEDTGFFKISIEDFKKKLEIQNKYKQPSDLKKRVLETAKKQINENTDLEIDYELEKKGRRYTNIIFTIKSKNPKIKTEPTKIEEKEELKIAPTNPIDEFKKFRQGIIVQVGEKKEKNFIVLDDEVFEIKDNLLIKDKKILSKEEAYDWWKKLFENKDKIELLSKEELREYFTKKQKEKETITEEEVKQLSEKYKNKALYCFAPNYWDSDKVGIVEDIYKEQDRYIVKFKFRYADEIKTFGNNAKVYSYLMNFNDKNELEEQISECVRNYEMLKKAKEESDE